MTVSEQGALVLGIAIGAYLLAGIWLVMRANLVRAGLAMLMISWVPIVWQIYFTDSREVSFGVAVAILQPIPIFLVVVGTIAEIMGYIRKRKSRPNPDILDYGSNGSASRSPPEP